MTDDDLDPTSLDPEKMLDGLNPEDLDGHSIDELSDYLDAGRQPRNASIENSPGARIALDALARLRNESWAMLEVESLSDPTRDQTWIKNVLANISRESRAGRDIPVSHPDPAVRLKITEGSVRGFIRGVGDGIGGAIMGKVELDGDVTVPGEAIILNITASALYGENLRSLSQRIRENITAELLANTELNVVAVNVTIQDVHTPQPAPTEDD